MLWRASHVGKGVSTAYIVWEVPDPTAAAPDHPAAVRVVESHGLMLDELPVPKVVPPGATLRPLDSDRDWERLFDLSVDVHPYASDPAGRAYLRWEHTGRRERIEAGGRQWGAFVDGRLVGAAALLPGPTSARYQDVFVDPDHRRRGLASALVSRAAAHLQARRPGIPMWIAAEAGSAAEAIYRGIGFIPVSTVFEASMPAPPTEGDVARLVAKLEDGTLPEAEWTHLAHLYVGLRMVVDAGHDLSSATDRMRAALQGFLEVLGVATTADRGYHETVTRGFLHLIRHLALRHPGESFEDLALLAALELGDKHALLRHWSRDVISSPEARSGWVEPDLSLLPL